MTSLKHKLRQIEEILQVYPNAFVRVKFDGDDNYRKYPSYCVTNEMKCEMNDDHFVL